MFREILIKEEKRRTLKKELREKKKKKKKKGAKGRTQKGREGFGQIEDVSGEE